MQKEAGGEVESMLTGLERSCRGGVGEGTSPGSIETWEYGNSKHLVTQRVGGLAVACIGRQNDPPHFALPGE